MQISVLGFGNVASQLARLWISAGHSVIAGLREGSAHWQKAQESGATVMHPNLAVARSPITVVALPWQAVEETLGTVDSWDGKILIDATNPLRKDLSILIPDAGSGGQQVAQWASGAKVVKAFNTIGAALYGNSAFDILYCGDDPEAKRSVHHLVADMKMRPQDVGPLTNAAYLEHIAGLWIDLAAHGRVSGSFGFNLVASS